MHRDDFGTDFTWGVASAAWQIEGAWDSHDKTPSIWDHAGHHRRVSGGAVGDDAIDFAHRFRDDLALVASLGFGAKRLSLSWPRLIPGGTGEVSSRGVEFYREVFESCRTNGLEPWVTLYHWDLPRSLHERGGWATRDAVEWFADYAESVASVLGDVVGRWMIANEPSMHALHHLLGVFDRTPSLTRYVRVAHHQTLAIAEAARRMRKVLGEDAVIGTTHQALPIWIRNENTAWGSRASRAWDTAMNRMFLDPLGGLGYPWGEAPLIDRVLRTVVRDGDEDAATHRFDFLGVQYYQPQVVKRAPIPGLWALPIPPLRPPKSFQPVTTAMGWVVEPSGLSDVLRRWAGHPVAERLVVTENGAAFRDELTVDAEGNRRVHDALRTWYYRTHLAEVASAIADGVPVDGYFAWSYADNIEWMLGRKPRFGLVYVDYDNDLQRTPKDSALWFQRFLSGIDVDA
ncbi:MAG: family 1 glycosylhydrolase [Actinobacteria bacterium]|nr:family 1 glycosylhydrolase [Actinomycetota bacterium]